MYIDRNQSSKHPQNQHPTISETESSEIRLLWNQLITSVQGLYQIDFGSPKNQYEILQEILGKIKSEVNWKLVHKSVEQSNMDIENDENTHHYCYNISSDSRKIYYYCIDCTEQSWDAKDVLICGECFIEEDHQGHQFFRKYCSAGEVYCHCSIKGKVSEHYKCKRHAQNRYINIQDLSDQKKTFKNIVSNCLKICSYYSFTNIVQQICQILSTLCQNSSTQCKIALQILKVTYKSSNTTHHLLTYIMSTQVKQVNQLLLKICTHKETHFELIVFLMDDFAKMGSFQIGVFNKKLRDQELLGQVLFSFDGLERLVQRRIFYGSLLKRYEYFSQSKKYPTGRQLLQGYLKLFFEGKIKNSSHFLKQLLSSPTILNSTKIAPICFQYCITNYSNAKKTNQLHDWDSENCLELRLLTEMAVRSIMVMSEGNQEKIVSIRKQLRQINPEKITKKPSPFTYMKFFQNLLRVLMPNIGYYFQKSDYALWNEKSFTILTILLMMKSSIKKYRDELLEKFWISAFRGKQLKDVVKNIYTVICIVLWKSELLKLLQRIIRKNNSEFNPTAGDESHIKNFLTRWFSCSQYLQKQKLVKLKNQVLTDKEFENIFEDNPVDAIMQMMFWLPKTGYDFPDDFRGQFWCWSDNELDLRRIFSQSKSIWYGFQNTLHRGKLTADDKKLLDMYLGHELIVTELIKSFYRGEQKGENYYMYIYTLVLINGLKSQKDKRITDVLNKAKVQFQQSQQIFAFYEAKSYCFQNNTPFWHSGELIKPVPTPWKLIKYVYPKENLASFVQELENKFAAYQPILSKISQYCTDQTLYKLFCNLFIRKQPYKLNKIRPSNYGKSIFKKQQQNIQKLNKNQNISSQCCICNQTQNDDLVYLSQIKIKTNIQKTFNQEENDADLSVRTCLHTVHLSCFEKMQLKKCPVCSRAVNCYFLCEYMYVFKQKSRQSMQIFLQPQIQHYQLDNLFMLLFKGFLSSNNIKSLENRTRLRNGINYIQDYEKNIIIRQQLSDKIDEFLLKLMTDIYCVATEEQKEIYRNSVQKFVYNLQNYKNKGIYQVEKIFSQILKQKIFDITPQPSLINQLQTLIQITQNQEFELINDRVYSLTQVKIPYQQYMINSQNQVTLKFQLNSPPSTSTQFQQKMKDKFCEFHGKDGYFYCLIQDEYFCSACQQEHHRLARPVTAYIEISNLTLHLKHKNHTISQQIYKNDILIAYNEREDYDLKEDEVFGLDKQKFNELVDQFLNC